MAFQVEKAGNKKRIFNFSEFRPWYVRPRKRAMLGYLTDPVLDAASGSLINRFSNHGIAVYWVRVLNQLGYTVDIIDWQDGEYLPQVPYDLIVLHGGSSFTKLNSRSFTKLIYFATGSYWKFNNLAEDQRIADFKKRHNGKFERERYADSSEELVNAAANGIIALGDPSMKGTFPEPTKVLTVNNASFPDDHFDKTSKNYAEVKNNFLFFAGAGNLHKGLDLCIDAFKDLPDQNLYVVTVVDKKFMAVFKNELELPNIHLVGEVNMRTKEFYEAMDKCAFVILPSCSEGQAGSVVEAMNQGLIPVVSKETRLDAREFGVVLKDNSISTIKKAVTKMAGLPADHVEAMAKNVHSVAAKDYSPKAFEKNLKSAIKKIIG